MYTKYIRYYRRRPSLTYSNLVSLLGVFFKSYFIIITLLKKYNFISMINILTIKSCHGLVRAKLELS